MTKAFIDGSAGPTGLRIVERPGARRDTEQITLSDGIFYHTVLGCIVAQCFKAGGKFRCSAALGIRFKSHKTQERIPCVYLIRLIQKLYGLCVSYQ